MCGKSKWISHTTQIERKMLLSQNTPEAYRLLSSGAINGFRPQKLKSKSIFVIYFHLNVVNRSLYMLSSWCGRFKDNSIASNTQNRRNSNLKSMLTFKYFYFSTNVHSEQSTILADLTFSIRLWRIATQDKKIIFKWSTTICCWRTCWYCTPIAANHCESLCFILVDIFLLSVMIFWCTLFSFLIFVFLVLVFVISFCLTLLHALSSTSYNERSHSSSNSMHNSLNVLFEEHAIHSICVVLFCLRAWIRRIQNIILSLLPLLVTFAMNHVFSSTFICYWYLRRKNTTWTHWKHWDLFNKFCKKKRKKLMFRHVNL